MSVFIQITQAFIEELSVPEQFTIKINSRDTELIVDPISASTITTVNSSIIASIKEQKLQFAFIILNDQKQPLYNLTNQLSFSPLYFSTEKEVQQTLMFGKHIQLKLKIFFTKRKNFLGPIEFYQYENNMPSNLHSQVVQMLPLAPLESELNVEAQRPQIVLENGWSEQKRLGQSKKAVNNKGVFFCCANNTDERKFEVQDFDQRGPNANIHLKGSQPFQNEPIQPQKIQFYKGPCQSKNMFSLCDAGVNDNKYTIVQDHYKNKNP